MLKTTAGAAAGMAAGLLMLACWGAHHGAVNGLPSAQLPPGLHAAAIEAVAFPVFLFWMGMLPGAVIGGAAGFGSWLVRPPGTGRSHAR